MMYDKNNAEFEDAILKLAISRYMEEQGEKYIKEAKALNEKEAVEEKQVSKFLKFINKKIKKTPKPVYSTKIIYKIAASVAVFLIALNMSVVTVPAVQEIVLGFLMEVHEDGMDINLETKDKLGISEVDSVEFEKEYILTYLPEGYSLDQELRNKSQISLEYRDVKDNIIAYTQYAGAIELSIDTEDEKTEITTINDQKIVIGEKEGQITAVWSDGEYILSIVTTGDIPKTEVIKMIEGIKVK